MTDGDVLNEGPVDSITTTLLHSVQQGDAKAWERLVDVYMPLVYHWCRQQGLQDADVLDVGQNVLERLAKSVSQFEYRRPEDSFRGWLRQVTRNAIVDHYRRQAQGDIGAGGSTAQEMVAQLPAKDSDEHHSAEIDEVLFLYGRIVNLVRGEFSEQDWQAFYRSTVDDQAPADVAIALGISRNQVYLAKSRIRKRLREAFAMPEMDR